MLNLFLNYPSPFHTEYHRKAKKAAEDAAERQLKGETAVERREREMLERKSEREEERRRKKEEEANRIKYPVEDELLTHPIPLQVNQIWTAIQN